MIVVIPRKIEDPRPWRTRPIANGCLIVANVVVYVLAQNSAWYLGPDSGWWTILTYGFSHATPWHLMGNMYALTVVGNAVNRRIGNAHYLATYLGTILVMGLIGRSLHFGPFMGSSGAIYAIVAVMLMLMPAAKVDFAYVALFPITLLIGTVTRAESFVDWFIKWGGFQARAWWCVFAIPVIELWGLFWWRYSEGVWPWKHPAHLLGFLCGVCIVMLMPTRVTIHACGNLE